MTGAYFLALARTLAADSTEAAWRTAVSRAYYAAFHVTKQLMGELGFKVPPDASGHRYLIHRISNCGDSNVAVAGQSLDDLRRQRTSADYQLHLLQRKGNAQAAVDLADRIIQSLNSARQNPTRTRITEAIKIYERDVLQNVSWQP
jgi:uncharacterized protein (UPF0332 family)